MCGERRINVLGSVRAEQVLQEDKMNHPKVVRDDSTISRAQGLTKAYVLITTDIGCEQEICNKLISIPEVKEAYTLRGVYDLIVGIEADDSENLKEIIQRKIRRLDKVRSTITMIERIEENEMRGT